MNEDMYQSLQRSWALARKRRAVDKKGLAVALAFLVIMVFGARACSGNRADQVSSALQEQPDLSPDVELRSSGKNARKAESSASIESMTGVKGELDDPRRQR